MGLSRKALCISIGLHALLFLAFFNFLKHASIYTLPLKASNVEMAYLSMSHPAPAPSPKPAAVLSQTVSQSIAISHPTENISVTTAKPLAPAAIQQLLMMIAQKIQQHLQYPSGAISNTEQGQTLLQFSLSPNGQLQNIEIIQSSGSASLDQAAIHAINASNPVTIPNNINLASTLTLRIPVNFSLQT